MPLTEIPHELYRTLFEIEVARGVNAGLWVEQARREADEAMRSEYRVHAPLVQCDDEGGR